MEVVYIDHYGTDLTVVNAARVSFDKKSEWDLQLVPKMSGMVVEEHLNPKDEKLIHYLAKHKHTSCFEHMGATLKLKVPIFIARQIQRHRTFSYNEISRRYVDTAPEFFYPEVMRARAKNVKQGSGTEAAETTVDMRWYVGVAVGAYEKMLEDGVAPEIARMILPQSMYTEFYMSGNLRAFSHFLKLRLDGHAQHEVQEVARMVEKILQPLFPVSLTALMSND